MWYFLSRYVSLSPAILLANLVCFLAGVVLVLGGIFIGGFAAGWTFLFPLPAHSLGQWGPGAAASYLIGVLLVGVGFLLLFLFVLRLLQDVVLGFREFGSVIRFLGEKHFVHILLGLRGTAVAKITTGLGSAFTRRNIHDRCSAQRDGHGQRRQCRIAAGRPNRGMD